MKLRRRILFVRLRTCSFEEGEVKVAWLSVVFLDEAHNVLREVRHVLANQETDMAKIIVLVVNEHFGELLTCPVVVVRVCQFILTANEQTDGNL